MSQEYRTEFLDSITDIAPDDWNKLVGSDYPFLQHAFLFALEKSGCTSVRSGWKPLHLVIKNNAGKLLALMPLYLKNNSMGEYVFDWSWADAYSQHGLEYYPKLVTSIPFTPSTGPRVCIDSAENKQEILTEIVKIVQQKALTLQASSWHILFPEKNFSDQLTDLGMPQRQGCQYQWFNKNYADFEAFLQSFSSRKRKNLKKERKKVQENNIQFEWLNGNEVTPEQWQSFYRFYQNTYLVRGRSAYLNLPFFLELARLMPDQILLVMAKKDDAYIAGALSFKDNNALYGRYWGCDEEWQFLHFETCYYQGIEYCIKHKLQKFDSGAQGEHKIQRGFEPVFTFSNHWISHPQFSAAINQFIEEEKDHLSQYQQLAEKHLPYKKNENS
ncbi:MAG: GNAT family N-acetyltransferase [SAR86 cluster bacterium]|uniref:GNAT family N-acetyltransferase n=1 Tax=SAR86 cluster bacterium TaxID=2030880 RepID=A0A2A5CIH3_9GAMM|nr:MAG: GNAT family N-acetyltransferase [SAR86 cluster bacterium]